MKVLNKVNLFMLLLRSTLMSEDEAEYVFKLAMYFMGLVPYLVFFLHTTS